MERAVAFGSSGALVGVVTTPDDDGERREDDKRTGVVFLNAGIVHRAGPHRLYVTLARTLARRGAHVLRFDHSGIGDSIQRRDHLPFAESGVAEAREAMNLLEHDHNCSRFVLVGLCSGTLTAFHTACQDTRVVGLALLTALLEDPSSVDESVINEALERRTASSYVTEKALSAGSWSRLLTGKVSPRKIARVMGKTLFRKASPAQKMSPGSAAVSRHLEELLDRGVRILFVYGEPTTVLEYFRMTLKPVMPRLREHGSVEITILKRSDHTFTPVKDQQAVVTAIDEWIDLSSTAIQFRESACT